MKFIEIVQPNLTPIILPASSIQSIVFRARVDGGHNDAVLINVIGWNKPLVSRGPHAEDLYCRIKAILTPDVLEFCSDQTQSTHS
jgi:hypothetical protein